ncbi:MAG: acyl-CoA dehydrogenase family protein, partial [Robiginitomaculum sp.]|nr:acyl-CoA dehydrogenase family protein [Robiginitomaculum sp.]
GFAANTWQSLADLGVIGMLFKEQDGGYGGTGFDLAIVFEEIGRAGIVSPLLQAGVLAGGLVAQLANAAQKNILENVMGGKAHLALAHAEPNSRYSLSWVETRAKKTPNGFSLSGRKSVVEFAHMADALIISARITGNVDDEDGISLFIIPKDLQGISWQTYDTIDGRKASAITLDNVQISEDMLLGEGGNAYAALEKSIAHAITALCAEAVGAMESAKDLTLEYLRTREQFGVPIGKFQALQHRMADMLIEIEQARSAVINAAAILEEPRYIREKYVSAAKNLIGRVGKLVAEDSVQLHGGIGMTAEYALAHFAKRLIMIDHQLGDTDHHLERFIRFAKAKT